MANKMRNIIALIILAVIVACFWFFSAYNTTKDIPKTPHYQFPVSTKNQDSFPKKVEYDPNQPSDCPPSLIDEEGNCLDSK